MKIYQRARFTRERVSCTGWFGIYGVCNCHQGYAAVQTFRMGINSNFAILITFRYQSTAVNIPQSVYPNALNVRRKWERLDYIFNLIKYRPFVHTKHRITVQI
jgi:hypothetical protein